MATRSYIGYENEDKTISFVYCHKYGQLNITGKNLLEHYNSKESAKKLVENGFMSSLVQFKTDDDDNIVDVIQSPDYFKNKECSFIVKDLHSEEFPMINYLYIYTKDGWKYCNPNTKARRLMKLTKLNTK